MEGGIIVSLKTSYRHRMLFRIFDNMDVGSKFVYNVDISNSNA